MIIYSTTSGEDMCGLKIEIKIKIKIKINFTY